MPQPVPTSTHDHGGTPRSRYPRVLAASIVTGVVVGTAAWSFLEALDLATRTRVEHGRLVLLLPLAGLAIGTVHHRLGGRSRQGTLLILRQIRDPHAEDPVPARMAPLVGLLTVTSHLFGASVGREGAALQIGGSLADQVDRLFNLTGRHRRMLLIAALGGAFGSVFGVPWAGLVFGLELHRHHLPGPRRERATLLLAAAVPTAMVSWVGHSMVRFLGHDHGLGHRVAIPFDAKLIALSMAIGLASGFAAAVFTTAAATVRRGLDRLTPAAAFHPAIGGVIVLGLVALVGTDHLGLSLPLRDAALAGDLEAFGVPAWKLLFTVVCVGAGFIGGEVTPLFVVGSTLGSAVAAAAGADPSIGAAVGFAAVFAGAARTPLACTVLTAELLGPGLLVPALIACLVAQLSGGRRSLYAEIAAQSQPRWRKFRYRRKQPNAMRASTAG